MFGHRSNAMSRRGFLFALVGFVVGGALGFAVSQLVFSFEYGGAGGGGEWYKVYVCGMEISPVGGALAGPMLQAVPFLFSVVMGIVGGIMGARMSKRGTRNSHDSRAEPNAAADGGRDAGSS
jgi:hypothetical protein